MNYLIKFRSNHYLITMVATKATVLSTRLTSCKSYVLRKRTCPQLTLSLSQLLLHSILLSNLCCLCFGYMLSPFRLSSVCLSVVTFVHPTRQVKIFGNFFRHLVPLPSIQIHGKFYGDRPRESPPSGDLNARVVAKYSDL